MRSTPIKSTVLAVAAFIQFTTASAQQTPAIVDASIQQKEVKTISLDNFKSFKASVRSLTDQMGLKKIVGLAEGTHGTAEFYKVRSWISRILIEDKGFRNIAFENDLSDVWFLNEQLKSGTDLNVLMKDHLMSIWQNEETKELLSWVKKYNKTHKDQVTISGIDYPLLKPDVDMLLALLANEKDASVLSALSAVKSLEKAAALQDEAWNGMNDTTYKADMKTVFTGSKRGYVVADSIGKLLGVLNLNLKLQADVQRTIANLKQGFAPFYGLVDEGDRDSLMAFNASLSLKSESDKMIIWAHNAHLAKSKIYGGAVGGTGGYLLKLFPDNYFVLGTGTANGTFAATTDKRPTNTNPMKAYPLEEPSKDSWETILKNAGPSAFYLNTSKYNPGKLVKPLRFIGFSPKSGASSYDQTNLSDHFDAYLFIKETKAATPLK
ncbi:erythromycin esterase family protein [Pedobacter metabolipauper]|uniref:Erythromycin esterase-like protein n=1 Tax=Pedobacter metabolipauper TaxID=425513 RepID=A0A4R6T1C0_9SPHI|nr:erythromycin esterase family protein [Pedobacter metabolipauper]TDQ11859.1 erythromycin esterase-like protein [Pedobacter metabolipauper]